MHGARAKNVRSGSSFLIRFERIKRLSLKTRPIDDARQLDLALMVFVLVRFSEAFLRLCAQAVQQPNYNDIAIEEVYADGHLSVDRLSGVNGRLADHAANVSKSRTHFGGLPHDAEARDQKKLAVTKCQLD